MPVTFGNPFHLGNADPRPGSDLIPQLMNGVVFSDGVKYVLSEMDWAILTDVGIPVLAACTADVNGDRIVDDTDFVLFASSYNLLICEDPHMAAGCPSDLNDDGAVDDTDFVIFAHAYDQLLCP